MEYERNGSFYVGPWLIESRLNRISLGEEVHQVEPKVMQVLVGLAEKPGEVVTKDEMMARVWAGTVVTDDVLSRAVSELRKVFGDDPYDPAFIETIRKTGYRLIAPVKPVASSTPQPALPLGVPSKRWPRWILAAALLVLAGIVTAVFIQPRSVPEPPRSHPLTSYPGLEVDPALSPDGQHVAFAWDPEGGTDWDIYVKQLASERPLRLTQDAAPDGSPAWSPDGSRIAFLRRTPEGCGLYVVPVLGGAERKLGTCRANNFPDLAWSPDGRWLAFNDVVEGELVHRIILLDARTGARRTLTQPPASIWGDYDPAFSPDGRFVAFARAFSEGLQDLFVVPVEGGAERRLTSEGRNIYGHTWMPDGRHLLLASNRGGTYDLVRVSAVGGAPEPVLAGPHHLVNPSLSRAGRRLVYELRTYETNLWLHDRADSTTSPLITSTRWDMYPSFSPGGMRLAFVSDRSGSYELWVAQHDGTSPVRLTSFEDAFVSTPRWSPDGRFLAFDARREGHADIYVIDAEGGRPRRLTTAPSDELAPSWSPDGRHLFFGSNRDGTWQIWRLAVAGGEAAPVTQNGGFAAVASPDGQMLYYTKFMQPGLWRRPLPDGDEERVLDDLDPGDWGNWVVHEEGIFHVRRAPRAHVALYDVDADTTTRLFDLPRVLPAHDILFDVSPDGQHVLYAQIDRRASDLVLVEPFR